jgi:murein DD-endopeptidase MepM/ murein hydrolase activator NlpD
VKPVASVRRRAAVALAVVAGLVAGGWFLRMSTSDRDGPPTASSRSPPADPGPAPPAITLPEAGAPAPPAPAQASSAAVKRPAESVASEAPSADGPGRLLVPVAGVAPEALRDTFTQARGAGLHEAIDIMAPTGTPVLAVDDGTIAKRFTSVPGGITLYQFDPTGRWAYYYAHLDRYADGIVEGKAVRRGEVVGYVGSTGNVPPGAPHLHFAVFRLGPEKQWWKGEAVNPFPLLR